MEKMFKICTAAVIRNNDKLLVVKRQNNDEEMPGSWEFPGGGLECGESIIEGLIRELNEEIGCDFSNYSFKLIGTNEWDSQKENVYKYTIQLNYLLDVDDKIDIRLSDEHTDFSWEDYDSEKYDDFIKLIVDQVYNS